jgi:2'-5' RNA ligase
MPTKRIFIAVDISDEARSRTAEHIDKMRQFATDVRVSWERPEKLHITLKFFGNVDENLIDKISDAITRIAGRFSSFEIAVTGTGVFTRAKQPRVLWLGIEDRNGSLAEIASQLDSRISRLGFEKEERSFSPHLTIARVREPQKAKGLAGAHLQSRFGSEKFIVTELVVYQSELKPTGSVYSVISRHSLRES